MSHLDNILIQIRSQLQQNGVKLWLEPYYTQEFGACESEMQVLARDFEKALGINYDYCCAAIKELQDNALEKLKAREEFQKTGLATIKVKALFGGSMKLFSVQISLTELGQKFYEKITENVDVECTRIKVIFAGKVIKVDKMLSEQGLTNNQQVMALLVEQIALDEQNEANSTADRIQKAREDALVLINSQMDRSLTMEDQSGNAVHLPPKERTAILMALALYEKGRSAMKRKNYSEALVMFLEADQEFSSCNSNLLKTVDNYALLNLDIVWCYLCLKSLAHLPDCERRLYLCEQSFQRSYGQNLDRVVALKGSSENERALIMRLHVLQGVLLFHQNRRNEAHGMFSLAETELRTLKVDDGSVTSLIEMGYTPAEARTALRSCAGDVFKAVSFIIENREKKKEARKKARKEHALTKGVTLKDGWVNPRTLHTLVEMGFDKKRAIIALKNADNDLTGAVDILQNKPSTYFGEEEKNLVEADDELVDQLVNIGFPPELARTASELAFNNHEKAVDLLIKMQNENNCKILDNVLINDNQIGNEAGPSTSSFTAKKRDLEEMKKRVETAYENFADDVEDEDEDYLNLSLEQEQSIISDYRKYLN